MEYKLKYVMILFIAYCLLNIILIEQKDPIIDIIINQRILENKKPKIINGYRIMIYYGKDINEYLHTKKKYLKKYPDHNIYFQYYNSIFILTIGNYESYYEAHKQYQEIYSSFKDSKIINSEILYSK